MIQLLKLPKNQKIYLNLNDIKFNNEKKDEFESYLKIYEDEEIKIKQTTNGFVYFKKDEPNTFYTLKDTTLYNVMIDYIQTQIVDKTSIKDLVDPKTLKENAWLLSLGIDFHKEFHQQMLNTHFKNLTLDTPILTPIQFLLTYYPNDFQNHYKNHPIQSFLTPIKYHKTNLIVNNLHPFISIQGMGREFYESKYLSYLKTMINELDVNDLRQQQLLQSANSLKYLYNETDQKDIYHLNDVYTIDLNPHIYFERSKEIDPYNTVLYNELIYYYNNQPNNFNELERLDASIKTFLKDNPNTEIFKSGYLKDVLKYKFNYDVKIGLEKSKHQEKEEI